MTWARATIEIKPASVGTGIKASLRQTKKSAAMLTFTISEAIAWKQLGWADKDGIEIMIGDGEHHGLIRLRKNKSTAQVEIERRETAKGAWFSLKLGHQPSFVDRSEKALWCQWEKVEEGWVEIVLPKWADETAPKRKAPQPSAPPANTAPRRVTNVTASLMGDPEPGRREMMQQTSKNSA